MEGKRGSTLIFHIYFGSEDNTRSLNHRRITKSVFDQRPEDTHSSLQNRYVLVGNDSNLLIVFYVQIVPDDFVMQLHRF